MADSAAVRARRYRQHKAGDHSACRHDRPYRDRPVVVEADFGDGFDPAEEMRKLAGRLSVAYQADPSNAALARELRATLLAIKGPGDDADDLAWNQFIEDLSTPSNPGPGLVP